MTFRYVDYNNNGDDELRGYTAHSFEDQGEEYVEPNLHFCYGFMVYTGQFHLKNIIAS